MPLELIGAMCWPTVGGGGEYIFSTGGGMFSMDRSKIFQLEEEMFLCEKGDFFLWIKETFSVKR